MVLKFPKDFLSLFWGEVGYITPKMVAETSSELLILVYQTTNRRVQKNAISILKIVKMAGFEYRLSIKNSPSFPVTRLLPLTVTDINKTTDSSITITMGLN
jgi:hypothetical protein